MVRKKVGTITLAAGLISVGAVLLARNFIDLPVKDIYKFWPVLLIGLGVEMVLYMIAYNKDQSNVKFHVDGWCITLIIILGVLASGSNLNFKMTGFDFPINIDGDSVIDNIRYSKEVRETIVKENIAANVDLKTVRVRNDFGDVKILPTDGKSVKIEAQVRVKCNDTAKATAYAKDAIEIREGSTTEISPKNPSDSVKNDYARAYIDFTIYVPKQVDVVTNNSFGDTEVNGVEGNATIDSRNGNVSIENIDKDLTVENAFGEIDVKAVKGKLEVVDRNGNIEVQDAAGFASIENHFGNIDAKDLKGGIKVDNNNGNITVRNVKGNLEISHSFGNINTENIDGSVAIEDRNGNINVQNITGNASITNAFGNIEIDSDNLRDSNIDAKTHFGEISTNLVRVSKEGTDSNAQGSTGSGKFTVKIENRNGNINLN